DFVWQFVDDTPVINRWRTMQEVPSSTPASDSLSRALKKRGFSFVGSTICYAYMQAVGMVNDHLLSCPQHRRCQSG
ncbi:MAG: DNA-3-methyladenine glycosylase I, partial [Thiogranum sp.]